MKMNGRMGIASAILVLGVLAAGVALNRRRTVGVPDFAVAVRLSKGAESRLHSVNESISVAAYFDGDGEPMSGERTAPFRAVFLGSEREEVNEKNVAEFKRKRVSAASWKRLSDKNYFVTINVFSARKATPNNILSCDSPTYRIDNIKGRTVEVPCGLLDEHAGSGQ
jgi:hypothetical protein